MGGLFDKIAFAIMNVFALKLGPDVEYIIE